MPDKRIFCLLSTIILIIDAYYLHLFKGCLLQNSDAIK